jgi:hypothetical protein
LTCGQKILMQLVRLWAMFITGERQAGNNLCQDEDLCAVNFGGQYFSASLKFCPSSNE